MTSRHRWVVSVSFILIFSSSFQPGTLAVPQPPPQKQAPPCEPGPCGPGGSANCTFWQCPQTYVSKQSIATWCASSGTYIDCDNDVCYYSPGLNGACCTDTSICCPPDENGQGQRSQQTGSEAACGSGG